MAVQRDNVLAVIPARWESTRFPGKVLASIAGKPMIQHVWERVSGCADVGQVIIACDHPQVEKTAQGFGAETVLTDKLHPSGTDRLVEAVARYSQEIILNVQGDEPLIDPAVVSGLAKMMSMTECRMGTAVRLMTDHEDVNNPNVVKAVLDESGHVLYFSRSVIPYNRDNQAFEDLVYYKHIGLYGFRREFLMSWPDLPASHLEQTERLEQLRALAAGIRIQALKTDYDSIGVDTPEDISKVERILNKDNTDA